MKGEKIADFILFYIITPLGIIGFFLMITMVKTEQPNLRGEPKEYKPVWNLFKLDTTKP